MTNFEVLNQALFALLTDAEADLSLPVRRTVATLTASLLEGTDAHLTALAEALPDVETDQAVKEQRIRRFLSTPQISPQQFLPLFIQLLRPVLSQLPELVLSMDRTYWKKRKRHVNILMVALHFEGRAIPLFWIVLSRAGNSSLAHWQSVLTPVITHLQAQAWLQDVPILVTADREFASPQLAEWLFTTYQVDSALRLKRSEYLCDQSHTIKLADLLATFPCGHTQHYRHVTVTKRSQFLVNVTITWSPSYEEPLLLITTFDGAPKALSTYQCRFGIEPMFKDQKSNGFNLENTKVTDAKRIETLLILTTLAHIFCSTEGYRKESQGDTKKNGGEECSSGLSVCS